MRTIRGKQTGMTLMELLTVIMIVAILATVALSTYRRYLIRAQRSDATTALLRLQSSQEKHFLQYGVYVTATANLPNAHTAGGLGIPTTSERGFYTLAVASTTTGYTATATPTSSGGQSSDAQCASLSVTETGTRSALSSASADTTAQCFR